MGWLPRAQFHHLARPLPLPYIKDATTNLAYKTIFSVIDLVKAFHHIPVAPDDVSKTAIKTPFGLFKYLQMPFGLCNAPQTYQRFMDEILKGLEFMFYYLDDILIFSTSAEEHEKHLRILFKCLDNQGLTINPSKSQLGQSSVQFLGYIVSTKGLLPLPHKVEKIWNLSLPKTIQELR